MHPAPPSAAFTRAIESRVELIAPLTEALCEWASAFSVAPRVLSQVSLMLDELITNIVTHGYGEQPGRITVEARLDPQTLTIHLRDHAPPFNPLNAPEPDLSLDLEQREMGGLGVHFVRQIADGLHYQRIARDGQDCNELCIQKRL